MYFTVNCIPLLLTVVCLPQKAEMVPSFTTKPPDQSVMEGDNTTLQWAFNINGSFAQAQFSDLGDRTGPQKSIGIKSNGGNPIIFTAYQARFGVSATDAQASMTIIDVQRSDDGTYRCQVLNTGGESANSDVKISVQYPANITHISDNQTVSEDDVVTLNCTADGYPAPNIVWTRSSHIGSADGNAIPTTTQIKGPRNSSASFPLNITGKQDEGYYRCTANNGEGSSASKDVYVTVANFRPFKTQLTTSLLNDPVKLNETFNITCIAEANPPAKYRFNRKQELVFNDTSGVGVYTTYVSDRVSPVIYRCIPYNSFGDGPVNETTVTVYYPAKVTGFTITACKELYDKGENLSITCQVEGNPKPGITWTKEGSDEIISRSKTLYVAPSLVTGRAVYNCTASNGVGAASSAKIDVQEATVIRLRMTLNGVLYSKNLTDLGSDESKNLTERIVPNISKAMNGTGLLEIMITKYGSGSVVVFFTLIFNQSIDGEMVILLLKNATSRGDFGDLDVDPSSIMLIQATEPPPSGKTNCSSTFYTEDCKWKHLWTIIFVVLVVVVVLLIVGVVVWRVLKIRKCRGKSPKVANTCTGEEGHVLQEFPDGAYAQVNQSYAKSGPAPANEYDQGAAGASAVPPVTYAVVDKSKKNEKPPDYAVVDKSKKKKKSGANEEKPPEDQYAVVLKSQKKKNPEEPEQQHAQVDRSMKKKHAKPGEVLYADLGEFHGNNSLPKVATSPELLPPIKKPPPAYVETQYADITQFLKGDATLPPSDGTGGVTSAAATPPGEEAGGGSSHVSKL